MDAVLQFLGWVLIGGVSIYALVTLLVIVIAKLCLTGKLF